jgi:hypothetical protein
MRFFFGLFLPLILQVFAYVVVFMASRGGGSFMGLLAMPVAAVSLVVLLVVGITGVRGSRPILGLALNTLAIAVVPPIFLLVFRALES